MRRQPWFVAAAIVQQQHPRSALPQPERAHQLHACKKRRRRWRIGVPDSVIPQTQRQTGLTQRVKQRQRANAVTRSKQLHRLPREDRQALTTSAETLHQLGPRATKRQPMILAMEPQQVPFGDDTTNQVRTALGLVEQHEKRRPQSTFAQQIEHPVGKPVGRPIVEGQEQPLSERLGQLAAQVVGHQQHSDGNPTPQEIEQRSTHCQLSDEEE